MVQTKNGGKEKREVIWGKGGGTVETNIFVFYDMD